MLYNKRDFYDQSPLRILQKIMALQKGWKEQHYTWQKVHWKKREDPVGDNEQKKLKVIEVVLSI